MALLDGLAENYRKKLRRHADAAAHMTTVVTIVKQTKRGPVINRRQLAVVTSRQVIANQQAAALANLYVNTARTALNLPPVALPVTVEADTKRISQALEEAARQGPATLERVARSEVLQAAQRAVSEALVTTGQEWVRHTGPNPCPLCKRLADGKPRPPTVPLAIGHPNCSCTQRFVEEAEWRKAQRKKPRRTPRKTAPKKVAAKKATSRAASPQKATRSRQKAV